MSGRKKQFHLTAK